MFGLIWLFILLDIAILIFTHLFFNGLTRDVLTPFLAACALLAFESVRVGSWPWGEADHQSLYSQDIPGLDFVSLPHPWDRTQWTMFALAVSIGTAAHFAFTLTML